MPRASGGTDYPTDEFEKVFRINLRSPFALARDAARGMVARGFGRIIMVASVMVKIARPDVVAYGAAYVNGHTLFVDGGLTAA